MIRVSEYRVERNERRGMEEEKKRLVRLVNGSGLEAREKKGAWQGQGASRDGRARGESAGVAERTRPR